MKIISIFIISIIFSSEYFSATIQGYVIDKETLQPLVHVNVIIDNGEIGTTTDKNGFFVLKDVSVGMHSIRASFIGYNSYFDSINIKEINETVELKIKLDVGVIYIDTVSEIENYHRYFDKYNSEEILKILLDSLSIDKNDTSILKVYSTFYNKTDTPIYVIRDIECLRMIEPEVVNSNGKLMKSNAIFVDCVGEKIMPDSSDFIKILPNDSINYPPVFLYFNIFTHYPKDDYKISLSYKYERRNTLPGTYWNTELYAKKFKEQFYYYNMALRGEYKSTNYLKFNNSQLVK